MCTAFDSISLLAGGALAIYLLARLFSARNEVLHAALHWSLCWLGWS